MGIKIHKKGKLSDGREYIVLHLTGDTKLLTIKERFGQKYYQGWDAGRKEGKYYSQVLWLRPRPLTKKELELKGEYW